MSYLGGKSRQASFIFEVLNRAHFDGWDYVEPFCGYCHVLRRVARKKTLSASDCHPLLLRLLRAVQAGEALPGGMSRARYQELRGCGVDSLERAVACFGFSFNGRAWGGYTSRYTRPCGRVDDLWQTRCRYYARLRGSPGFARARLCESDYCAAIGESAARATPRTTLIYMDPPYAGASGYGGTPAFDSEAMWATAREWSLRGAVVLVSEYTAPSDFVLVASCAKASTFAGGDRPRCRTERLFAHSSCAARLVPPAESAPGPV